MPTHSGNSERPSPLSPRLSLRRLQGMNLQAFVERLNARDKPQLEDGSEFVPIVRSCLLLRGLATLLAQPPVSLAWRWRPLAEALLKKHAGGPAAAAA